MKDQLLNFFKNRTTTSIRTQIANVLEFPTTLICFDPATKLSKSLEFGFNGVHEKFEKDVLNKTIHETYDELTYQLNKDVFIKSYHEGNLTQGLNVIKEYYGSRKLNFDVKSLRTYDFGACHKLEPKFNVTYVPIRIRLSITLNSDLQEMDRPEFVAFHFTSNKTWINILNNVWPQFSPLQQNVQFKKEYTTIVLRSSDKYFKDGIDDNNECLKKILSAKNCPFLCDFVSLTDFPTCKTVEDLKCMWKNLWDNKEYRNCFMTKEAKTFELDQRLENPYHQQINVTTTDVYIGMWTMSKEIQEQIPVLTLQDLIGSVGGSLGMFFGFSISSSVIYCINRSLSK